MSKLVSRRSLLSNGIKTGIAIIVLKDCSLKAAPLTSNGKAAKDATGPAYKRLDDFIAQHMRETGAPGMTLAIANRQGVMRVSHYGFADLKAGSRVGPQTLFEIGSISKSFVAIAMLQLADEGKIDLHKPVIDYLPWLKIDSKYPPFTAHHLLSHTAGLSGVPLLMRVAATTLRTGSEPGTRFLYSNIGYVLLGFLLEATDKRPLADVLARRVLEPLGMTSSEPVITNDIRARLATGYGPLLEDRPFPLRGKLAEAPFLEVPEAAGSVAATANDMVAYLQMLLNRGTGPRSRVLSETSFQLLVKPVISAPFRGEEASYSYGLWISEVEGNKLARHTGGMVAFSSAMHADLTNGLGVFASVNANLRSYRPNAVAKYALDLLRATMRSQDLPDPPPPQPAPDKIKNAADYAGIFTSPNGKKLVLSSQGERLILEHNDRRIVLEQAVRDRFIVKDPDFDLFTLGFGREKELVVEAFHGSDWWTNERYSGQRNFEYPKEWEAFTGHYRSDSPWYGSTRLVIRKGRLRVGGDQPITQIEPGVFRPDGDATADRIVFDTLVNGKAMHMNYSGIDFYRAFTS
ncbi:MAG: serine hydrolase domain-containing protein [Pyrinomonadaceae bacterium]